MSTISSATAIAVNPAFLQEIKDSNPDLWMTVENLRRACRFDDEAAVVSRRLTRLLDELRDGLALQFSLEESYGYIALPEAKDVQLSELCGRVQQQHGMLYLSLSELAEQAEELQYRGVERPQLCNLIEQTKDFDRLFVEHERLEADLIERSFESSGR